MKYHSSFFQKLRKMSQNVSSAAVVIGVLRVSRYQANYTYWCEKTLRLQMKHKIKFVNSVQEIILSRGKVIT